MARCPPMLLLPLACVVAAGCGGDDTTAAAGGAGGGGATACAPGERATESGECQPAGLPRDAPCPPGQVPLSGGGCQAAGVPPGDCAAGFTHDGEAACEPILPASPCPAGSIAVPGDTSCHEIAPCGSGTWGAIPVAADTEYVDASFQGVSDGTAASPWITVQQGINAAVTGAIVAIASGSYLGDVAIENKAVRLWGRCPAMVEIVGSSAPGAAVLVSGADGSELRDLAVRGPSFGVGVSDATGLILERVWLHDFGAPALDVEDALGPAEVTLAGALLEGAARTAIYLVGSTLVVEASAIRDTQTGSSGSLHGVAIAAVDAPGSGQRATLTVRGSLLERNQQIGIIAQGADVSIRGAVVRNTAPSGIDGLWGRGLDVEVNPLTSVRSVATLQSSLIEASHDAGVLVLASELTVASSVVRGTLPHASTEGNGFGVAALPPEKGLVPSEDTVLGVTRSLVEDNQLVGVFVVGSQATIEGTLVRDTLPWVQGALAGRGLDVSDYPDTARRSDVTVRFSAFERNREQGIGIAGSNALIDACAVRDTLASEGDPLVGGRGINAQVDPLSLERPEVTIVASLIEASAGVGVVVLGGTATIETSLISDTKPRPSDMGLGRGIVVQAELDTSGSASATLSGLLVQNSLEVGIGVVAADAIVDGCAIRTTAPQASDQTSGDGIAVQAQDGLPASVRVTNTLVAASSRAGVAAFGAAFELGTSRLDCNAIHLDGEYYDGRNHTVVDLGGNACGCADETALCRVLSSMLPPPTPL